MPDTRMAAPSAATRQAQGRPSSSQCRDPPWSNSCQIAERGWWMVRATSRPLLARRRSTRHVVNAIEASRPEVGSSSRMPIGSPSNFGRSVGMYGTHSSHVAARLQQSPSDTCSPDQCACGIALPPTCSASAQRRRWPPDRDLMVVVMHQGMANSELAGPGNIGCTRLAGMRHASSHATCGPRGRA